MQVLFSDSKFRGWTFKKSLGNSFESWKIERFRASFLDKVVISYDLGFVLNFYVLNFELFGGIDVKLPQPMIDATFNVGRLRDQYHEYFANARISIMSYYVKVLVCKKGGHSVFETQITHISSSWYSTTNPE